jgi:integrase
MPHKRNRENQKLHPGWRWRDYGNGVRKIQVIIKRKRFGLKAISKVFDTKRDAEDWVSAETKKLRALDPKSIGVLRLDEDQRQTTLGEMIADYLRYRFPDETAEERAKDPVARETEARMRSRARVICQDEIVAFPVANIRPYLIIEYSDRRLKQVSSQTARHEITFISTVFDHAIWVRGYEALANPVRLIPRRRKPQASKTLDRRLEHGEKPRMVALAMRHPDRRARRNGRTLALAWLLALETSLRRGQLWEMRWCDVHLQRKEPEVDVTERKGRDGKEESRKCPLSPNAVRILRYWFRRQQVHDSGLTWRSNQRVFSLWDSPHAITRAWDRVQLDAKLKERLPFHATRHEAASATAERRGATIMTIKRLTGHRSLAAMQRYINLIKGEQASEKVER